MTQAMFSILHNIPLEVYAPIGGAVVVLLIFILFRLRKRRLNNTNYLSTSCGSDYSGNRVKVLKKEQYVRVLTPGYKASDQAVESGRRNNTVAITGIIAGKPFSVSIDENVKCVYCCNELTESNGGFEVCPTCNAKYHKDCWEANDGKCAVNHKI